MYRLMYFRECFTKDQVGPTKTKARTNTSAKIKPKTTIETQNDG